MGYKCDRAVFKNPCFRHYILHLIFLLENSCKSLMGLTLKRTKQNKFILNQHAKFHSCILVLKEDYTIFCIFSGFCETGSKTQNSVLNLQTNLISIISPWTFSLNLKLKYGVLHLCAMVHYNILIIKKVLLQIECHTVKLTQ